MAIQTFVWLRVLPKKSSGVANCTYLWIKPPLQLNNRTVQPSGHITLDQFSFVRMPTIGEYQTGCPDSVLIEPLFSWKTIDFDKFSEQYCSLAATSDLNVWLIHVPFDFYALTQWFVPFGGSCVYFQFSKPVICLICRYLGDDLIYC